jgi:DNA-binding response OmpR family regulator
VPEFNVMTKLLLVDDDIALCDLLREYLATEGFDVETVHDGRTGLQRGCEGQYELIILDVMLPELGGFEVLRELRQWGTTPVLMLTARGDDVDRIVGLEIGADDYLPKPCNPRELVARIRAILRRTHTADAGPVESIVLDDIELRGHDRAVLVDGEQVELTGAEFNLLESLLRKAGVVVSKEELSQSALGRELLPYDRSVDMHISRIRKKLGPGPDQDERVKTVRGVGYIYLRGSAQ